MTTLIASGACRLAPGVFLTGHDEAARLLDFERGRFYGLDAVSTRLLLLTLDEGPEAAARVVACEFAVPQERVEGDLGDLLRVLRAKGLLACPGAPERLLAGLCAAFLRPAAGAAARLLAPVIRPRAAIPSARHVRGLLRRAVVS